MPGIVVSGVRDAGQPSPTDQAYGISQVVVQDAAGKLYDVYVSDTEAGRKRLAGRVRAADTLATAREPGGMGFAMDRVLAFENANSGKARTGDTSVMVGVHHNGTPRPLNLLTLDDCSAVGTAIGAIHRLRSPFVVEGGYPAYTTDQIRAQLTAWIRRLRQAGHIPSEITTSWARVMETEGLWSFSTCFVHGGFSDGDILFSGSTVTTITNWQDMQINDPARDLAWIFAKLDETHRNAVMSAYGRMLGSRLDELILLRANLWLQMEQVGDFIQALSRADNTKIMQFKAQVERLAHQLGVAAAKAERARSAATARPKRPASPPSTITVGTLLHESEQRRAQAQTMADVPDDTSDSDPTSSSRSAARGGHAAGSTGGTTADATSDSTAHRPVAPAYAHASAETETVRRAFTPAATGDTTGSRKTVNLGAGGPAGSADDEDDTGESLPTVVIPQYEREERARRDAQTGLHADPPRTGYAATTHGDTTAGTADGTGTNPATRPDGDAADPSDSTGGAHVVRTMSADHDNAGVAPAAADVEVPDDTAESDDTLDPDDTGESMPKA